MEGVAQPSQINPELVKRIKSRKVEKYNVEELISGIRAGNRTLLSQAITLVESSLKSHQEKAQEIIGACLKELPVASDQLPVNPQSAIRNPQSVIRIGITGVPGVGKSTFIEAFGKYLTGMGHKVAVLAIDPSSSRSKGSILGDKTRMEELAVDPNAYIRPSPSAGSLGGVARKTRETIILCEAAGFDVILVETVGVGQSETAVHGMVDFFLLLMLAGAGDELQGIKRGIIEMADAIIINKADGDNITKAKHAAAEYSHALHLFPPSESGWTPVVGLASATTKTGIPEVWNIITDYRKATVENGFFQKKRISQSRQVLYDTIEESLRHHLYENREIRTLLTHYESEIAAGRINPYMAAQKIIERM